MHFQLMPGCDANGPDHQGVVLKDSKATACSKMALYFSSARHQLILQQFKILKRMV